MNDPTFVCRFEGLRELFEQGQCVGERDRSVAETLREVLAGHQLHFQQGPPVDLLESMERGDVRMVQRPEQAGLSIEPAAAALVASERIW